ncbi:hypothetical protein [Oceanicoccus sp. KOV_DT_Chl]|uniref:hypothetical protein n=1 Tax=Oceanicoccus sp. KOV_DT_Chl TaxID=1904639 RepID=UPI000C7BA6C9|nr:hypothetical protein [Oceanicoccus sp. KOV_DT_Chl]
MAATITLYKSISPLLLAHLINVDWRYFVPESVDQKLFVPKLHRPFAEMLARQLEVANYGAGYVVQFKVQRQFLRRYNVTSVAYKEYEEYCIPIEDLAEMNRFIVGRARLVSRFSSNLPRNQKNGQETVINKSSMHTATLREAELH